MYFRTIIKLCFHFLFYQLVSSSRHIVLQNHKFPKDNFDNLFDRFFVDFDKAYLQYHKPRHVTVVGTSNDDLQQAQSLFKSYPYTVCKETEKFADSHRLNRDSFFIIFLKDLNRETFEENIKILSQCGKCKVLFVFNAIAQINDVWFVLNLAIQHHIPYAKFAHFGKNVIELYSDFVAKNCTMEVRLVTVWRPGIDLDKINKWAIDSRDMNGCPVSVSTLDFTPKMMIEKNENGSLTILGGREGKLLLAIAKKLNFTIALRYPSTEDRLKHSRKLSIVNEVASRISEIGIGRLRPTNNVNNTIVLSGVYDEECETWGVPHVTRWSNGIVWVEFSWPVWISFGLVFVVGCIMTYAPTNIVTSRNSKKKDLGFVMVCLNAVAIHLGSPIVHVSSSAGGRFMLMAYLYYAMVITTAYKTSLASILATDKRTPKIVDAQGIINSNLKVGGSLYEYEILYDQANDSGLTRKLLERFVINNNNSMSWNMLFSDQDTAFLARRSSVEYERQMVIKAQKRVTFDVLKGCVLLHPTVMAFQAGSFLHEPVNNIIYCLAESGILEHWDKDGIVTDKTLKREDAEEYFEELASNKFGEIFIFYSVCIATSLFTFLVELLIAKFVSKKLSCSVNRIFTRSPHIQ